MTIDPRHAPDTSARLGEVLTRAAAPVRADRRLVPVREQRIALAAMQVLGAIEGLSMVDDRLAEIAIRVLAPTVNKLTQELLDAGWVLSVSGASHE